MDEMMEKKKGMKDTFNEVWDGMKGMNGMMGPFESPMGHGVVIKAGDDWDESATEYHHFLTHDADGKALAKAKHFVQRDYKKPDKKEAEKKPAEAKEK